MPDVVSSLLQAANFSHSWSKSWEIYMLFLGLSLHPCPRSNLIQWLPVSWRPWWVRCLNKTLQLPQICFIAETSKSSSSFFFFFFMKWEKEIKKLEKVEDREIKSVWENHRGPHCAQVIFMVLVLRHGQGQRLSLHSLLRSCTLTGWTNSS